jgi:23S rRNA pseudouridine2605 synthase
MASERVQKILARAGIASRRNAEKLIAEGLVTINGRVAHLGQKAELGRDAIKVKGKLLQSTAREPATYLVFNKPKGVISMFADPEGRATLGDFLPKIKVRLFPIGRLDFSSEGLILLTNDGAFAEAVQKDEKIPRVYHVKIRGKVDAERLSRLERGARLDGRLVKPHSVRVAEELSNKTRVEVVLLGAAAGVDLKAYFETRGFLVERIIRTAIGHMTIHGLQPGHYRLLRPSQAEALLKQPELAERKLQELKKPRSEPSRSRREEAAPGTPSAADVRSRWRRDTPPPEPWRRSSGRSRRG